MHFEDIGVTWKYSLSLLAWRELKLLLLASLNNFKRALKLTVTYFWWLWALWLALLILPITFNVVLTPHQLFDPIVLEKVPTALPLYRLHGTSWIFGLFMGLTLLFSAVDALIHFTYYLSTRASVEAKNFTYYLLYLPKIFYFFIAQIIVAICLAPLALLPSLITHDLTTIGITESALFFVFSALPLLVGYVFLDFDHAKITFALKKGLVLFVHFFPLMVFFSMLHLLILFFLYSVALPFLFLITAPLATIGIIFGVFLLQAFIISLLFFSCYATLYIKIKHSHPNLFFA